MTVYIVKETDRPRINWTVRVGRGRGSSIKSRHRLKAQAKAKGRQIARARGDVLKEQMQWGGWKTVRSYA